MNKKKHPLKKTWKMKRFILLILLFIIMALLPQERRLRNTIKDNKIIYLIYDLLSSS